MTTQSFGRIELVWPDKGQVPVQDRTGRWSLVEPSPVAELKCLVEKKRVAVGEGDLSPSIAFLGGRLDALSAVRRVVGRNVHLVYADVPRIEGFDESRAFLGADGRTFSIWLSMVREHFRSARQLLLHEGMLVAQAGDTEAPFVRIVMMEIFGRENYVGTALWQTHYSPKGGKHSNEIAPVHENLICFALDRESVARIALPIPPEGYSNPDGDPRGEWEARQKDAGRDTAKITYNVPPYRWSLVKGRLPKGIWRISPLSGVIWGTPQEAGSFRFTVRVADENGKSSEQALTIKVNKDGNPGPRPSGVWWMIQPPKATKAGPRVTTEKLPVAAVGKEYSAILVASGGAPYTGSPRPSRGWAFGQATLDAAVLDDRCYFGKKGDAIPETKKYAPPDGKKLVNLTSWWDEVAFTQDSTKHQNALRDAGLIEVPIQTAKPELLLSRVVEAFSPEGSTVVELFGRSGDLAAVALKTGRKFVSLLGDSDSDRALATKSAIPRIAAVATGAELAHLPEPDKEKETKRNEYLRLPGRGGFVVLEVGPQVATKWLGEEHPRLSLDVISDERELMKAVLTAEGFLSVSSESGRLRGTSWDRKREAIILGPREFLDQRVASELASSVRAGTSLTVYYFRNADDFAPEQFGVVSFRRVPGELAV